MNSIYTVSLSLLLGAALSSAAPRIVQEKNAMITSEGKVVEIPCRHDDSSYTTFFWYRQHRGTGLTLIGWSVIGNSPDYEKGFESGYKVTHPHNLNSTLSILKPTPEDTAVYFCAARDWAADTQYFGNGTRLTVLEDGLTTSAPNVTLFDPSPEEVRDKKKATLVCLATGFYPDYVVVTWTVNGKARTDGVGTDENPTRDEFTRMFSISSRLRLSLSDWFNPKNTFQCNVRIFHPNETTFTQETRGQEDCGLTVEAFSKHMRSAHFTYILVLWKAALYGLCVTVLVLRTKVFGKQFS